ncbi:hypothetical protein ACYF6T_33960 [Streptomyces sp. 7R007]
MRRTIHRATLALAALTLFLAGCGDQAGSGNGTGSGKGGGGDTVSPSSPAPSTSSPAPSTSPPGDCAPHGQLHAGDSGRTVCLAVGETLRIDLDGTAKRPWKPVSVSGGGLEATNSGFVIQPGDASAAYQAVAAGTARLSSQRPLCATQTGRVSCLGIQEWWVTVVVR